MFPSHRRKKTASAYCQKEVNEQTTAACITEEQEQEEWEEARKAERKDKRCSSNSSEPLLQLSWISRFTKLRGFILSTSKKGRLDDPKGAPETFQS